MNALSNSKAWLSTAHFGNDIFQHLTNTYHHIEKPFKQENETSPAVGNTLCHTGSSHSPERQALAFSKALSPQSHLDDDIFQHVITTYHQVEKPFKQDNDQSLLNEILLFIQGIS